MFESGRPIAHVARDLGIHKEALRHWVRQTEADTGRRRDLLTTDERDELKRLRRENAELRRKIIDAAECTRFYASGAIDAGERAATALRSLLSPRAAG